MTADLLAEDGIRFATRAAGLLAAFNPRGVLAATDVHVARRLGRLGGETDEQVLALPRTWSLVEDGQPGPWAWRSRPEHLHGDGGRVGRTWTQRTCSSCQRRRPETSRLRTVAQP